MRTKNVMLFFFFSLALSQVRAHQPSPDIRDLRPCGKEIDKCIRETRGTELGGCLGTAYGLYFAGEEGISNCHHGKYNSTCLHLDQATALSHCYYLGTFPQSCTTEVTKCIANFEN